MAEGNILEGMTLAPPSRGLQWRSSLFPEARVPPHGCQATEHAGGAGDSRVEEESLGDMEAPASRATSRRPAGGGGVGGRGR